MGTIWAECWKCDVCGFKWIKGEIWPERCASSKCRKRSWNTNGAVGKDALTVEQPRVGGTNVKSPTALNSEATPTIRKLIADPPKMNDAMAAFISKVKPLIAEPDPMSEPDPVMCSYTEYDTDTGESYGCRLRQHHAKVKHVRGPAL